MITFIVLVAIPTLLLIAARSGLLGERAHRWMVELNEAGAQDRLHRQLRDADRASSAAYLDARLAMNDAAGQQWRSLSEWRDE